jgi:hypothetical protein
VLLPVAKQCFDVCAVCDGRSLMVDALLLDARLTIFAQDSIAIIAYRCATV